MTGYLVPCIKRFNLTCVYAAVPLKSLGVEMEGSAHTVFIENFDQAAICHIAVIIAEGKGIFTAVFVTVKYNFQSKHPFFVYPITDTKTALSLT